MNNKETRSQTTEIRSEGNQLFGVALQYNVLSQDLGGFQERLMPNCFSPLGEVRMFVEHQDEETPLAKSSTGTLLLTDSPESLAFNASLPDTTDAKDLLANLAHRNIGGMSFGFACLEDRWLSENGVRVREVVKAILCEISPVDEPAYLGTVVSQRALDRAKENLVPLYEKFLKQSNKTK